MSFKNILNKINSYFSGNAEKKTPPAGRKEFYYDPPVYSDNFSYEVGLATDVATFCCFDPKSIPHKDDSDWWIYDFHTLPEVKKGIMSMFTTGFDGWFPFRITNQDLTPEEKKYTRWATPDMGVHVTSETLYVCGAEELPGGPDVFECTIENRDQWRGLFIRLENGDYTVRFYGTDTDDLDEELANSIPSVIMQLIPGKVSKINLKEEPSLFLNEGKKIFKSVSKKSLASKKGGVSGQLNTTGELSLEGLTIVFTGTFSEFTRDAAKQRAISFGAKVGSSVTSRTDYLVVGEDPGSKLEKAKELGIKVINEEDWMALPFAKKE